MRRSTLRSLALTLALSLSLAALAAGCATPPDGEYQPAPPVVKGLPPGVRHETGPLATRDGLLLFEQRWSPAAPTRASLVIVHGLKDHSARYHDLAVRLAARGIAVRAADLRGHARSAGPRVWVEPFDGYLDDAGLVVARARAAAPGKPLFLLGHSMGGAIATLYAIERGGDLSGLLLSAAAIHANASWFTRGVTRMIAGLSSGAGVFQLDLHDFSKDPKVVEEGLADPLIYQEGAAARTAVELLDALERIDERAADLRVPLLAMHGSEDVVTPPEGTKDLFDRARSTDKTLKRYEGLRHDLLHEPEREIVARDIEAWILERTSKSK